MYAYAMPQAGSPGGVRRSGLGVRISVARAHIPCLFSRSTRARTRSPGIAPATKTTRPSRRASMRPPATGRSMSSSMWFTALILGDRPASGGPVRPVERDEPVVFARLTCRVAATRASALAGDCSGATCDRRARPRLRVLRSLRPWFRDRVLLFASGGSFPATPVQVSPRRQTTARPKRQAPGQAYRKHGRGPTGLWPGIPRIQLPGVARVKFPATTGTMFTKMNPNVSADSESEMVQRLKNTRPTSSGPTITSPPRK